MGTDTDAQRYAHWLRQRCPVILCDAEDCEWHDAARLLEVLGEIATLWDAMLDTAHQTIDDVATVLAQHQAQQATTAQQTIDRVQVLISDFVRQRDGSGI